MASLLLKSIHDFCLVPRYIILSPIFKFLIGDVLWGQRTLTFYESLILDRERSTSQKEALALSSSHAFLRPLLRMYFSICRDKDHDFHLDVPKYVVMRLHEAVGLLDPTLYSKLDDRIYSFYDPLRDYMAKKSLGETWGDAPGHTITIFRFSKPYRSVGDVSDGVFDGFTRSFDINSTVDFSNVYYDVLVGNKFGAADDATKEEICAGRINAIAISYRHKKADRAMLGITKHELLDALRALHQTALPAGPSTKYALWWDSVLRCSERSGSRKSKNWAAIGLAPYAFCHVLSIRRPGEELEPRLWIDMERALGSLRMGLTAVDIEQSGASVVGMVPAKPYDAEWALSEAFKYAISGDVFDADVTFDYDRKLLFAAGFQLLCNPGGLGVLRGLAVNHGMTIVEVGSLATLEERLFLTTMTVRLGARATVEGEGDAYLDAKVELHTNTDVGDRRNWLANSEIYKLISQSNQLPSHVEHQVTAVVRWFDGEGNRDMFGLQLYYQEENKFNCEAVHGCVSTLKVDGFVWKVTEVGRLFVPTASEILESFKILHTMCHERAGMEVEISNDEPWKQALDWLWDESETNDEDVSRPSIICLPTGCTQVSSARDLVEVNFGNLTVARSGNAT